MFGIFGILKYFRLKLTAVFARLMVRFTFGFAKPSPSSVLHIPSHNPGRSIKINVYKPTEETKKPSPVLLNLHGSGFILPLHGSDDEFCALVARKTSYTVLDMQYRLAPENPFPAALNDVEDAVNWVLQRSDEYDLDHFAISGFSAGGNLALATCGAVFPKDTFHSVLAFYPSTDKSVDPADRKTPDPSGKVTPAGMSRIFDSCYIPADVDRKNPRVSPLFAAADAFPENCFFATGAMDNLCFEAEKLAAKIEETGSSNVVRRRFEKCAHAWDKSCKPGTEQATAKDEAYALAIETLQK